ncbi:MAG TPA: hypothetical protein VM871_00940 [Flavisolibacter sp.]|jgi:hypothetical protein|nr:hypothetical protein [Flavisolibacter sp.]
MRTFLLFIGSVLYPVVMVVISPVLLFLYFLLGFVTMSRIVYVQWRKAVVFVANLDLPLLHLDTKKDLSFRPKAVRLH